MSSKLTSAGRRDLVLVSLLVAATVVFWLFRILPDTPRERQPAFLGESFDSLTYYMPLADYAATRLRGGDVPLWNPYELAGFPLMATMQFGGWYPLNLLYLIMSPSAAWFLTGMLHCAIAGVCMFAFCRMLKIGVFGAMVAALMFMFCSWTIGRAQSCPDELRATTLMPLVFLCAEAVIRRRSMIRIVCLGAALGLLLLSGEPEIFVRTGMVLGPYIVCRLVLLRNTDPVWWRTAATTAAAIAAAYLICLALTAVQWIPTRELAALSTRRAGTMSPEAVWFGSQSIGQQVWNLLSPAKPGLFRSAYVSLAGLMLLILSPTSFRRRPLAVFFFFVAVAGFLLSLGTGTFLASVYYYLPTGNWFRGPTRLLIFFVFAAPVSAAFAADCLAKESVDGLRVMMRALRCGLIAVAAVSLICLMRNETVLGHSADGMGEMQTVGNVSKYGLGLGQVIVVISAASLGGLLLLRRARLRLAAQIVVCLLIPLDACRGLDGNRLVPHHHYPERVKGDREIVEFVRKNVGTYRTYFEHPVGNPAIGLLNGLFALNGRDPLCPSRFAQYVQNLMWQKSRGTLPFMGNGMFRGNSTQVRLLDHLAVRYIVVGPQAVFFSARDSNGRSETRIDTTRYRLAHEAGSTKVYENVEALPHAYIATDYKVIGEPTKILDELTRPQFDPRQTVILEQEPDLDERLKGTGTGELIGGVARIREYEPERVVVDTQTDVGGFLVLSDLFFPGWQAFTDGIRTPVYRANFLFRAVPVPPGKRVVTFRYKPRSFRLGAGISISTLVILFSLVVAGFVSIRYRQRQPG